VTVIIRQVFSIEAGRVALLTPSSLSLPAAVWVVEADDEEIDSGDVELDIDLFGDDGRGEMMFDLSRFEGLDTMIQHVTRELRLFLLTLLGQDALLPSSYQTTSEKVPSNVQDELTASRKCTLCRLCCISDMASGRRTAPFFSCMCRMRPASST